MTATRQYIDKHGKPVALYTDKHGVFRVNHASNEDKNKLTQYGRANKTLQDRLTKEMRLAGITGIDEANQWLGGFIEDYNRRFAKPAKHQQNVHRPVYETQDELCDIFSWQLTRQVSKALTLQYDRVKYMLSNTQDNERLAGKNVMIYDYPDGNIAIKYLGKSLEFTAFDHLEVIRQGEIVENKRLREVLTFAMTEQEQRRQSIVNPAVSNYQR